MCSRAMSTAAHCSAQPLLRSLFTVRFHALKRPLQQRRAARRGCLLMKRSLTMSFLTWFCRRLTTHRLLRSNGKTVSAAKAPGGCSQLPPPPGLCKRTTRAIPRDQLNHTSFPGHVVLVGDICLSVCFCSSGSIFANRHSVELIKTTTKGRQTTHH